MNHCRRKFNTHSLALLICVLIFSVLQLSTQTVVYSMPLSADKACYEPNNRIINKTSREIWVLYQRPKQNSQECEFVSQTLPAGGDSINVKADPEAIWVQCFTREVGCVNGIRPFKIGAALDQTCQYHRCIEVWGDGDQLRALGATFCRASQVCGWVKQGEIGTDGLPIWPTYWTDNAPSPWSVRYNLDSSQWTCLSEQPNKECSHPREIGSPIAPCNIPNAAFCAEYYNNSELKGSPSITGYEANIDKNWGSGGVGGTDNFSARWQGRFGFTGGNYKFTAIADDGIRVYIDNNRIIDAWRPQAPSTFEVTVPLSSGEHTVKVEYFEYGGGAVARFDWQLVQGQGGCPAISAWKGEYWSGYFNGSPALCRNDSDLNFDWGGGSPGPGIPSDNFTARWTRTLNFNSGRYRFHLAGDDGFSLRIDDRVVIDKWISQARTEYTADIDLSGGNHTIKVEYFEGGGQANISLWWETIAGSPPGGGGSIDTNKVYRIIAVHSGKGLDVSGASQDNGATIHQWTYAGGANQRWRFESTGDGYYMIRAVHSNNDMRPKNCQFGM